MTKFSEIKIKRISVLSILKICLLVVIPGVAVGILFGTFALLGFNTVRWGNDVIVGFSGFLLGVAISLVAGLALAIANTLLIWAGMAFFSMLKTTKLQYQPPHEPTDSPPTAFKERKKRI